MYIHTVHTCILSTYTAVYTVHSVHTVLIIYTVHIVLIIHVDVHCVNAINLHVSINGYIEFMTHN